MLNTSRSPNHLHYHCHKNVILWNQSPIIYSNFKAFSLSRMQYAHTSLKALRIWQVWQTKEVATRLLYYVDNLELSWYGKVARVLAYLCMRERVSPSIKKIILDRWVYWVCICCHEEKTHRVFCGMCRYCY